MTTNDAVAALTEALETTATDEHGPIARETRYLDLDGDGLPDAVQIVDVVPVDSSGNGVPDAVEVIGEVASEIGVDGVPEQVTVVDTTIVELTDTAQG
jgi:hypothetical protein